MIRTSIIITSLLISGGLQAQIQFEVHAKQLTANMEELPDAREMKATSECGEVSITWTDRIFSGGCAGNLVREFKATDNCGNEASTEQFIRLVDTTPPVFAENTPGTFRLNQVVEPMVSDNNRLEVDLFYLDEEKGEFTIRTWTATDACGNTATLRQTLEQL